MAEYLHIRLAAFAISLFALTVGLAICKPGPVVPRILLSFASLGLVALSLDHFASGCPAAFGLIAVGVCAALIVSVVFLRRSQLKKPEH